MKTQTNELPISLESSSNVQDFLEQNNRPKIPYMSVLSDRLVFYRLNESPICKRCIHHNSEANLHCNTPSGHLSRQTRSKIRKILDTWLSSINEYNNQTYTKYDRREHYPIFITLTLSSAQVKTDNYIKRNMLSQFIDKLQYNHQIKNLFWRAEKQKNGNLHFHIITDKFIDYKQIRKYWNDIQEKEGYIDSYKYKTGKTDPPSTHVRSADSVKNFVDYVIKYSTKEDENGRVEGRIYGMTDSLRKIRTFITSPDSNVYSEVDFMINKAKTKIITEEHATTILFDKMKITDFRHMQFVIEYKKYLIKTYTELYQLPCLLKEVISDEAIVYDDESTESNYYQRTFFDECPDYCPGAFIHFYDSPNW